MSKGSETKEAILRAALDFSSKIGLESLSIGELAKKVGMSKSGLFGHFNSKEKLQMMVIDYAAKNYTENIFIPSFKKERGIPRILAIVEIGINGLTNHLWVVPLSLQLSNLTRTRSVRDHIKKYQNMMLHSFQRSAKQACNEGHLEWTIRKLGI